MKVLAAALFGLYVAVPTWAQDCRQATRNYEVSNGASVRNQEMVNRAYQDMLQACGGAAPAPRFQPAPPPPTARRAGPGQFVNCDTAGCWGSANGVRYNFAAGGNLVGTDGSFCARGAGNTFTCN